MIACGCGECEGCLRRIVARLRLEVDRLRSSSDRKIQIINRTPFELDVENFGDGDAPIVTFKAHAGVIGDRGVCGGCGELRHLYLNPSGPVALCEICLVNRPVRAESL